MEEIAQVYARALFGVASEQGRLDEVREQLGVIADAFAENRDLSTFFFSPYFSSQEKKEGLDKAFEGLEPAVRNFLELLIENHRMPVIYRIRREYDRLWEKENKLLPVQVTTAVPLDRETVDQLGERIGAQTGQRVELTSTVDPDILGGLVLRVGNSILDASIRNRLNQLRKEVAKA